MLRKIGVIKNTEIELNEEYIKEVASKEFKFETIDSILGVAFCTLGYMFLFVLLDVTFRSFSSYLLPLTIFLFVYSAYLLRSHNALSIGIVRRDLNNVNGRILEGKMTSFDITPYISNGLLNEFGRKRDVISLFNHLTFHDDIRDILKRLNIDRKKLTDISSNTEITESTKYDTLLKAVEVSLYLEREHVDSVSMYIALIENVFSEYFERFGLTKSHIEALKLWLQNTGRLGRYRKVYLRMRSLKPTTTINRALTSRYSPTLIEYSTDLTVSAIKGNVMFSLARDKELNMVIENLSKSTRSATLIVGEPGIGKSTLIKSIGVRMVIEEVPDVLKDMRLVSFNFSKAFALSKGLDDYKSIIQKSLEEAGKSKNIILVIDDFDQFINVRSDFVSEIVGLFTKAWEEYNLKVIATCNREGFTRYISNQKSLASIFSLIELVEPSEEVSIQVLLDKVVFLEKKYSLKISFEALVSSVKFGSKILYERTMPEKGIYVLEKACIKASKEKQKELSGSFVEKVISEQIGVKVGKLTPEESKELDNLESTITKRILGQIEAVVSVSDAIKRSRAEISSGSKPLASFLFYGPTGVGKTELAKVIADVIFHDKEKVVRIDLSEYQEEENLGRLIGKTEGTNFTGGELTEFVRKNPFCVVILDEIEKAKPRVLDLFLQLLDEGYLVDGAGRKVIFTNTIVVATSNVASKTIADSISHGESYNQTVRRVELELRNTFKVEFLNRFDKLIMFKPLYRVDIEEIANIMLIEQIVKLKEKGIDLSYTPNFLTEIAGVGYNPVYGARSMRRAIQDHVESRVADLMVKGSLVSGGKIEFNSLSEIKIS